MSAETFLGNAEVFTPVFFAKSVKEAENYLGSKPIQVVLVQEGVPSEDLNTLMEMAKSNVAFVYFVGNRPVVAETISRDLLPSHMGSFKEDDLLGILSKTDIQASDSEGEPITTHFFVKSDSTIRCIRLDELVAVEAQKDYVLIHMIKGSLKVLSSMKHFEARLPQDQFVRVHRSFIIRLASVEAVQGDSVDCGRGFKIPIGPSFRQVLISRFNFI